MKQENLEKGENSPILDFRCSRHERGILEISRIDNTVSLKKGGEDPPPQEWEVKGIRAERGVQKGSRSRAGEQDEQNITGGIRDNSTKTDGKDGFKGDSEHPIPQERRLQKILRESWSIGWYITKGPNLLEMPPCGLPSTGLLKDGDVYLHHVLEQKGDHKGYLQTWTYDGGWQRIEVGHRRWLKGAIREFKV